MYFGIQNYSRTAQYFSYETSPIQIGSEFYFTMQCDDYILPFLYQTNFQVSTTRWSFWFCLHFKSTGNCFCKLIVSVFLGCKEEKKEQRTTFRCNYIPRCCSISTETTSKYINDRVTLNRHFYLFERNWFLCRTLFQWEQHWLFRICYVFIIFTVDTFN